MTTGMEIEEALDWQGSPLDCEVCENLPLSRRGQCELGKSCVHDRYARRIDRFFDWNPALAKQYLEHSYFETRAIAAKHVEVFYLSRLVDDPDETVRQSVALRLPTSSRLFLKLKNDPHREVRIRVAQRIGPDELGSMIRDPDYFVRQTVAQRLPEGLLVMMSQDTDPEVRKVVASRVSGEVLFSLAHDHDVSVRISAINRLPLERLPVFLKDPDWQIRYHVALRIDPTFLRVLSEDPEAIIREVASNRLEDFSGPEGHSLN